MRIRPARYTAVAPWYDIVSLEWPVYRAPRLAAVRALGLRSGDIVLDVGCGTGLNLAPLHDRIGAHGRVVGVDSSASMLAVARRKAARAGWERDRFMHADAGRSPLAPVPEFDAAIATYALSLMPEWETTLELMVSSVRPGGRVAVVDLAVPPGPLLGAAARLACRLGGSEPSRRPGTLLAQRTAEVAAVDMRGGHVLVRVGEVR